jgi:hypothetical protein
MAKLLFALIYRRWDNMRLAKSIHAFNPSNVLMPVPVLLLLWQPLIATIPAQMAEIYIPFMFLF